MEKITLLKKIKQKPYIFMTLVLPDQYRKPVATILFEYTMFLICNRKIAKQYFNKFLYHKGVKNYDSFLVDKSLRQKCWDLNDQKFIQLVDNKHVFEDLFSRTKINIVRSVGFNQKDSFYANDNVFSIKSSLDFLNILLNMLDTNSELSGFFIKKAAGSYGGSNTFRIWRSDFQNANKTIENIYREVIKSKFLFQNIIVQHKKLDQINPGCINSIRIDTYTNKGKEAKIFSAFLRVGLNHSHVDNVSSGGAFVGVNIENGTLYPAAFQFFEIGRGKKFLRHPETNFVFEGFKIPFFEEAKKMAIEAAQTVPMLKVVGWDIAITPNGPVLIEGGSKPGLESSEISQNGFLNNPVFMELFEEVAETNNKRL